MTFYFAGIGTATPKHAIAQNDAAEEASRLGALSDKQRRLLSLLYRQAGVGKRHSVLLTPAASGRSAEQSFYQAANDIEDRGPSTMARMRIYEQEAGPLATLACARALEASRIDPREITHLVTVSCSGFHAPGFDLEVARALGLSNEVSRTHLGFMGCHGALNGLRVCQAFTDADLDAKVLLCAVELCTLHHQFGWNPDQIVANALFADGAAAVVGTGRLEPHGSDLTLRASGSTIIPGTQDFMGWRIGDHGFEMTLSPRLPEIIAAELRTWLERWLDSIDAALCDIEAWAIHPGGPRIIQACASALELGPEAIQPSLDVLAEFGNMSSPTVLFILERLTSRSPLSGPCVLLAFGPGLTIEAALAEPVHARAGLLRRNDRATLRPVPAD